MMDMCLTLAQEPSLSDEQALGILAGLGAMLFVILAIALAIAIFITYLLYAAMKRVPEEHQQLSPGLVWLMLVPLLNIVWIFIVTIKLSDSLKSYFDAAGEDVGDAGKGLGIAWGVCNIAGAIIPFVGIATLVLMIIYLVKVSGLKNRIPEGAGGGGAVGEI